MLVTVIIGGFIITVPTLPSLLLPRGDDATYGDAAQALFNGSAFDRIWEIGTGSEKAATVILLVFGVACSFIFTLGLRQLVYVFYREVSARWVPPPPATAAAGTNFFQRLQFWNKHNVDESTSTSPKQL